MFSLIPWRNSFSPETTFLCVQLPPDYEMKVLNLRKALRCQILKHPIVFLGECFFLVAGEMLFAAFLQIAFPSLLQLTLSTLFSFCQLKTHSF